MKVNSNKKVLIVDDEELTLEIVSLVLSGYYGIGVMTARNGREAIEILNSTHVDLVLTDLNMPEMNGFELVAWMRKDHADIPVLVMTAACTPDTESRLRKQGISHYIEKPFDVYALRGMIMDHV